MGAMGAQRQEQEESNQDILEENVEKKDDLMEEEPVEWWEELNIGYTEESDVQTEFYWNEDLKNGIGGDDNSDKVDEDVEARDG